MNIRVEQRVLETAEKFILQKESHPTVRSMAKEQKVSKSTVYKDMTERLLECNPSLYKEVNDIIMQNKAERHIRGGEATKQKILTKNLTKRKNSI